MSTSADLHGPPTVRGKMIYRSVAADLSRLIMVFHCRHTSPHSTTLGTSADSGRFRPQSADVSAIAYQEPCAHPRSTEYRDFLQSGINDHPRAFKVLVSATQSCDHTF